MTFTAILEKSSHSLQSFKNYDFYCKQPWKIISSIATHEKPWLLLQAALKNHEFYCNPWKIIRKEEAHEAAIEGGSMEKTARKTSPPTHTPKKQTTKHFPVPVLRHARLCPIWQIKLRPAGCCSAMPWLLQVLLLFIKKGFWDVAKVANLSFFFKC